MTMIAHPETIRRREEWATAEDVGMTIASLHSALSGLRELQRKRPDLIARDLGELLTAQDVLTVIVGDAEKAR